ncbi:Alpha/Beta hydrolase protein [Panaeolus papilionaceus]|nr:Alpha/Beta hydrolase protein [Panaeolus papilionaceus]
MAPQNSVLTLSYKTLSNGDSVLLDVYLPVLSKGVTQTSPLFVPTVVFFHGGGLTAGSKDSFIPLWLVDRVLSLGYAFVSPNYQLIPPATGHEIKQDVLDVFTFLKDASFHLNNEGESTGSSIVFKVDTEKIVVSGSSAGGLCACLAAASATPRPKALLSIYAMGGNFLSPWYIEPKTFPSQRDPKQFEEYTYPFPKDPVSPHTEVIVPPGTAPFDVPKLWLMGHYYQLGVFADHYTGCHEPSLSKVLQAKLKDVKDKSETELAEALADVIPESQKRLFPQILAADPQLADWPPTLFIHGTKDKLVGYEESVYMKGVLEKRGVSVELIGVEGEDHAFYYVADAEERWGWLFDRAVGFVKAALEA